MKYFKKSFPNHDIRIVHVYENEDDFSTILPDGVYEFIKITGVTVNEKCSVGIINDYRGISVATVVLEERNRFHEKV